MKLITEDFLLGNQTAKTLYHEYADGMGIFDYHCHIPPREIAENRRFENLTQIWLGGDHYKWRLMRANGVDERYITGGATDEQKFRAWAETIPKTVRNPVYHWSYLELSRYFGLHDILLNPATAGYIYEHCRVLLQTEEFTTKNLIERMNVKVICTTDDPTDDLRFHRQIREDGFAVKVLPAFRPDRARAVDSAEAFNEWVGRLERAADRDIGNYRDYLTAIRYRHDHFHAHGCRLSDHGVESVPAADFTDAEIKAIFGKIRKGGSLDTEEKNKFKSALMLEMAMMDAEKGWVHQLHLGAIRSINSRMSANLGPDTGYDAMGDFSFAVGLARFLDSLSRKERLPKMILYNVNPKDNEVLMSIAGSFQDGGPAGKMQYGSAWWFLDQKEGMTRQLNTLSNLGLLSRFIGMTTDSRSLLSYPRHEYFRRILCNIIGTDRENGEILEDIPTLGEMVKDISFRNAERYFNPGI